MSSTLDLLPRRHEVLPSGCWRWLGGTGKGYGRMRVGKRILPAHRVYYEASVGAVPAGCVLDHLCRNPLCVNPAHLEVVTNAENIRRGLATKLSATDVAEMRRLHSEQGRANA